MLVCAGLWAHTLTVYDYQGASPSSFPSQFDKFMSSSYTWVRSYHLIGETRATRVAIKIEGIWVENMRKSTSKKSSLQLKIGHLYSNFWVGSYSRCSQFAHTRMSMIFL